MAYFEYCTIKDLREEGVTIDEASPNRLRYLIRVASDRINRFTGQVFQPIVGDQYVDGQNSPLVYLPGYIPIISLTAISIEQNRTARQRATVLPDRRYFTVSTDDVELSQDNRMVEWVTDYASSGILPWWFGEATEYETWFPRGRKNVKLSGVFGWLEGDKSLSTTTTSAASSGDAKVEVDDTTGWEPHDWAIFDLASGTMMQKISGVDEANSALLFADDGPSKLQFDVPSGTTVQSFGRTPMLIRRAATRLVVRDMSLLSSEGGQQDDIITQAIVEEKIDNYRYKIDADLLSQRIESGSTGDAQVDSILQQFIDEVPTYIGMV